MIKFIQNRKRQSNNQFSPTVWMNFQTESNYPIEIWASTKSQFSPTVWMNFQTRSDYPIAIWQVSNPNFPRPFGRISRPGLTTQFWFDKNVKSQFFPDRLDEFPNRVWLSNCDLTKMSNPNFSPTVWMNFQTESDYPIAIWLSVKSQIFADCLNEFPNRVWLPNCNSTKCQIPIFPRSFG